jgi:hypothetical protein
MKEATICRKQEFEVLGRISAGKKHKTSAEYPAEKKGEPIVHPLGEISGHRISTTLPQEQMLALHLKTPKKEDK